MSNILLAAVACLKLKDPEIALMPSGIHGICGITFLTFLYFKKLIQMSMILLAALECLNRTWWHSISNNNLKA